MNALERREQIIERMKIRKFDTAFNLAYEFGVSWRTIIRDVQELSCSGHPIVADMGRGGGIRWVGSKKQFPFTDMEVAAFQEATHIRRARSGLNLHSQKIQRSTRTLARARELSAKVMTAGFLTLVPRPMFMLGRRQRASRPIRRRKSELSLRSQRTRALIKTSARRRVRFVKAMTAGCQTLVHLRRTPTQTRT